MTPVSFKVVRILAIWHEYKVNTATTNIFGESTNKDLRLVRKISNKISNIPQWLPPNVKIDIKLQLNLSNFLSQN